MLLKLSIQRLVLDPLLNIDNSCYDGGKSIFPHQNEIYSPKPKPRFQIYIYLPQVALFHI